MSNKPQVPPTAPPSGWSVLQQQTAGYRAIAWPDIGWANYGAVNVTGSKDDSWLPWIIQRTFVFVPPPIDPNFGLHPDWYYVVPRINSWKDLNAKDYFSTDLSLLMFGIQQGGDTRNQLQNYYLFRIESLSLFHVTFTCVYQFYDPATWIEDKKTYTYSPNFKDPYNNPYKSRYQADGGNIGDQDPFYQVVKSGGNFYWAGDSTKYMDAEKPPFYTGAFDAAKSTGAQVTSRLLFDGNGGKDYLNKYNTNDFVIYAALPIGAARADPAYLNETNTVWKWGYKRVKDDVYLNDPTLISPPEKAKSEDLSWWHTVDPASTDIKHGQLNPILPPYAIPLVRPFETKNIIQKAHFAPWVVPPSGQLMNLSNPNITPDNRFWDLLRWYGYTNEVLTGVVVLNVAGFAGAYEYLDPRLLAVGPILSTVPFVYNFTSWTIIPYLQWLNEWFWLELPNAETWAERQAKIYAGAVTDATVTACVIGGVTLVGGFITGTAFYVTSLIPGINIYSLPILLLGSLLTAGLDVALLAAGGAAVWWDVKANGGNGLPSFGDIVGKLL